MENVGGRLDDGDFPLQLLRRDFTSRQPSQVLGTLPAFDQSNIDWVIHLCQSTASSFHCQVLLRLLRPRGHCYAALAAVAFG
jgi:hypothetical protein